MNDFTAPPAEGGMGHNNPPSDIDIFGEKVKEKYPEMFAFAERLLGSEERLPKEVNDDEVSGKVGDFVKQVQTAIKNLDAARKSEKEEYLEAGRRVDGFFKVKYIDKLTRLKDTIAQVNAAYLKRKEDEERRIREEKAEQLRLEAEEKLRLAREQEAEANRKREEAEAEQRRIAAEAEAREKAIREEAARKAATAQAEIDRLNAEKATQAKVDQETRDKLKAAQDQLKAVNAEAKADLKELKEETKEQMSEMSDLAKDAKGDMKESRKLLDDATRTDKQAEKMEKLAGVSAADLARTRGEGGSLSTIETKWVGTVTNREIIDMNSLRQHFKDDDIQIALNSWVKANPGKQMPGAFIREETKAVTR